MAKFSFDVSDYTSEGSNSFDVMPKGEYTLKGIDAEMKDTKAGTGKYLSVTFEIVKGEFQGRRVWMNFNLFNPNDKAEKIGREQLASWARACGKPNAGDSDELLERPFQGKLDIEKGTGGYEDKNVIKAFLSGDVKPAKTAAPAAKFSEPEAAATPKSEPAPQAKKNPWD